ncbi:MAG: DUF1987 domain-containing protein [Flammeovirgaceae bacterium]|nr:DUF1987 domain-containing protein [Flammeovirgaceae bacterium]MDW8287030.1 DUF1987 domain-containing protein [Flammeovirgaceae bacterium]
MTDLYIEAREFIPEIDFHADTGVLNISGDSYHEYTHEFFDPIFAWIDEYTKTPGRNITLNFKMNYFNTASSKCFFDIIEMLQKYQESGKGTAVINWYYQEDDEDMLETGQDYILDSGYPINLIAYR